MRLIIGLALVFTGLFFALPFTLLADGKVFVWRNEKADIYQPTQKAVIFWDGHEERLVLQTKYAGPAEKLVWIVPLPGKPSVKKGSPRMFEKYSRRTQEPDIAYTRFRLHGVRLGDKGHPVKGHPVLEWRRKIGAYDVALLAPEGRDSVVKWLRRNEYGVDDRSVPILKSYVDKKWWIVASRIHRDALGQKVQDRLAKGTLHPLEFTF